VVIVVPNTAKVIEAIIDGLDTTVAPELIEPPAQLAMGMALQVLRTIAVRSANEIAWMQEESVAIEALARRMLVDIPDENAALSGALDEYVANTASSLHLGDAQARYERASEVLSCATELAYARGAAEHRAAVHRLFEQRLAHENSITGGSEAVGRS
jgi:hypothetical protein